MTTSARFIPARELARQLAAIVEPKLRKRIPDTPLTLALIGSGSDVLGYDTARSMDHDWGPRLTVLVPDDMAKDTRSVLTTHLDQILPSTVEGFPTRYSWHPDGTTVADPHGDEHRLQITSVSQLLRSTLLIDSHNQMSDAVWLSTPMQVLLEFTAGDVFVDDAGELTEVRRQLAFYPDHIWRYQLAGLWMRVSQVQPFVGRCFEIGDVTGAATIALAVVRDLQRIALLQSRQYAPYAKWLGTAVSRIDLGVRIKNDLLEASKNTTEFSLLEQSINAAGGEIIRHLNTLQLIPTIDPEARQFHSRPFQILPAEEIALALRESVQDPVLASFDATLGGIDILSDSTDALVSHEFRLAVRRMFSHS